MPSGSSQQLLKGREGRFLKEDGVLKPMLEENFGAGLICPTMGLAEPQLAPPGPVQRNLKAKGRVLNGEELGPKEGGELHEEVKFTKVLKEVPRAGQTCPEMGLTETSLSSSWPAQGPLEAAGRGVQGVGEQGAVRQQQPAWAPQLALCQRTGSARQVPIIYRAIQGSHLYLGAV